MDSKGNKEIPPTKRKRYNTKNNMNKYYYYMEKWQEIGFIFVLFGFYMFMVYHMQKRTNTTGTKIKTLQGKTH
jgi:hypothetical protein